MLFSNKEPGLCQGLSLNKIIAILYSPCKISRLKVELGAGKLNAKQQVKHRNALVIPDPFEYVTGLAEL